MRLVLVLGFLGVLCGVAYFVFAHPGVEQLDRLERELDRLAAQNDELAARNEILEERILALRDDPRLVERRARETVGLSREDELVFVFESEQEEIRVRVRLMVGEDSLQLAGRPVELHELSQALEALREEMPRSLLVVSVADGVGPIERQRVMDLVDASPMAPAVVEN